MAKINQNIFKSVHVSYFSATFELICEHPYFSSCEYDVYLGDELVLKDNKKNVFTLFNLTPNTSYMVKVENCEFVDVVYIKTLSPSKIYNVLDYNIDNSGKTLVSSAIQELINKADTDSVIYFPKGIYLITPLFVKSNLTIYLEKDAILLGEIDRGKYPIIPSLIDDAPGGSWEGVSAPNYASIITAINVRSFSLVGEGVIDGNAQNSDWWINHKVMRGAWRPHDIFINQSSNIDIIGVTVRNSASWTIHPYYSSHLRFIDLTIEADKSSPNTDGIDPESCDNVLILGVKFNTGDDCIAIKSGKIEMVKDHYKPTTNVTIRNCYMGDGHGGVVFGSEASCGIEDVSVSKCYFDGTDRGFRIKTRRGRGDKAIIKNVFFDNIYMNNVKNGLVINMFYYCDADGKSDYVQSKTALPVDSKTPHLGSFTFKNMQLINTRVCAGYFYGLPEAKIEEINLENIKVTYTSDAVEKETPAMMLDCEELSKGGFYFRNVDKVNIKNVDINGQNGKEYNY